MATVDDMLRSLAEPHAGTLTTLALGNDVSAARRRMADDPAFARRIVNATAHLNATRAEMLSHIETVKQHFAQTSEGGVLAGPIASGNKSRRSRKPNV